MTESSVKIIGQAYSSVILHWDLQIAESPLHQKYQSTSFEYTDSKYQPHEWRLELELESTQESFTDTSLTIRYLGEDEIALSNVQFQIFQQVLNGGHMSLLFSDMDEFDTGSGPLQLSKEGSSHSFYFEKERLREPFKLFITCILKPSTEGCNTVCASDTYHQLDSRLQDNYETLLLNGKFSDFTVSIANKELFLHKDILSSRSLYFFKMFDNEMKENNTNSVNIDDFTYDVMLEFFRYIYAAKVNDIKIHMVDLLVAADKYALEDLKSLCEHEMIKALSLDNALNFLSLANCHNARKLEAQCLKFIVLNAKDIVESPNYDLGELPKKLTNELFRLLAKKS
ncbi:hypothetical protein QAD02_016607 [Eretmocerus hayati]|uniref:Uncharacterized protein n=1 Tax=Eretmocerus hayati TaxID=131215 RepID=A0ACC2PGD2_9HYME|nr:hypothetical protein QAD02_016607 [Eretmocerus hayati]